MRNFTLTLLACTALAFGTFGCDAENILTDTSTADTGGTDTGGTDLGTDTAGVQYFAVMVSDEENFDCSNISGNHGADVDAIHLLDSVTGDLVSWAVTAGGSPGDGSGSANNCSGSPDLDKQDPNAVIGDRDGSFAGGFVALAGGWVSAEFGSNEVTDANTIQIYEVGVDECGPSKGCKDDIVQVSIATGLDCPFSDKTCSVMLSTDSTGDATIAVSAL